MFVFPATTAKKRFIYKHLWHMETKNALFITMHMWQQNKNWEKTLLVNV